MSGGGPLGWCRFKVAEGQRRGVAAVEEVTSDQWKVVVDDSGQL